MRVLRLSKEMMYVSVSYDITSTKARNRVVTLLESYGFRVQKSVFEIECNESQYRRLKIQLEAILTWANSQYPEDHCNGDSIKFYILSKVGEGNLDGRIDGL
jgi:hypothetical protein